MKQASPNGAIVKSLFCAVNNDRLRHSRGKNHSPKIDRGYLFSDNSSFCVKFIFLPAAEIRGVNMEARELRLRSQKGNGQ